jgi:hypothetical protein
VLISVANTQLLLTVANLRISCFFVIGQRNGIWFGTRWEFRATQERQEFSSRSRNHDGIIVIQGSTLRILLGAIESIMEITNP